MENSVIRKKYFFPLFLFLVLSGIPLQALNTQLGVRGCIAGGYASGKGLWDWTDTTATGTLQWGTGYGGGLLSRFTLNDRYILEGGINYVSVKAGQTLDSVEYTYSQKSIEFPLMFKTLLPFQNNDWYLGAGPNIILLPFEATRNNDPAEPDKSIMLALQTGIDYKAIDHDRYEMLISANFIHPVTSPAYNWVKESSGSIRINRLELCTTLLFNRRGQD